MNNKTKMQELLKDLLCDQISFIDNPKDRQKAINDALESLKEDDLDDPSGPAGIGNPVLKLPFDLSKKRNSIHKFKK